MILNGSQRGGAKQLGLHLLNAEDNEQVEIHEVSGFLTGNVVEAFKEVQALAKGTKCTQPFFSVSLSPPETENVPIEQFEAAIGQIEEKNRLTGQPRVIVFHEKEGRRHAHVVWSRIDPATMTAKNLPHFKLKLRDISRDLFFQHGWKMPRGLINSQARDPRNFKLAEWQQAKRIGLHARDIKQMVQECWAASDSRAAFTNALSERGFTLARGDRRDFVLVSCEGEVLGLRTQLGKRTNELRDKLGDAETLPSVSDALIAINADMKKAFQRHMREASEHRSRRSNQLEARRTKMTGAHKKERAQLEAKQKLRSNSEALTRAQRLRRGFAGLWQIVTGNRAKIVRQNEREALECFQRDRQQRDSLISAQLDERRGLQQLIKADRQAFVRTILKLRSERSQLDELRNRAQEKTRSGKLRKQRRTRQSKRAPRRSRNNEPPSFDL